MILSICAVIAVRNEASYLRILLPLLAKQEIDVVIIDNGSTDNSHDLYTFFSENPIILVEYLPYEGVYSQRKQLEAKQEVYRNIEHDWVIHHDADEILEHYKEGYSLRDAIEEADAAGYNVLNFDELVFLPEPNKDYRNKNYYQDIHRYYFFEPSKQRLHRAWKRMFKFDNMDSGGHTITSEKISVYPENHVLRHYVVLGYEHAKEKYLHRTFNDQEIKGGWHHNRLDFTEDNLRLPYKSSFLFELSPHLLKKICRDTPTSIHYWKWEKQSSKKASLRSYTPKTIICVVGMHRSGTSVIARSLQVLDVELGNSLMPPDPNNNPTGYWEDLEINELNIKMLNYLESDWHSLSQIEQESVDELCKQGYFLQAVDILQKKAKGAPIFGFKDPRTAKLLPFWKKVFAHCQFNAHYIIAVRHPLSVCMSLQKRDDFEFEKSYYLWLENIISSFSHTEGERRIAVNYDLLIDFPDAEIKRIAKEVKLSAKQHELMLFKQKILSKKLRHTQYQLTDLAYTQTAPQIVQKVWPTVFDVTKGHQDIDSAMVKNNVNEWREELRQQKALLKYIDSLERKNTLSPEQDVLLKRKLSQQDASIREITSSKAWQMALLFRHIRTLLLPANSRREKIVITAYSRLLNSLKLIKTRNN
ncbi:MAG: glycosyltransferase [Chloroflexi bacterium]|nr:glycosyltransferase [Chloroflexota bacterium]